MFQKTTPLKLNNNYVYRAHLKLPILENVYYWNNYFCKELVFINNKLSQHIEITENNDEDILWLRVNRKVFPDNNDMYICCTYISPKSSSRYTPDDTCKLDILNSDVLKYKNIRSGRIVILGDLNCRT